MLRNPGSTYEYHILNNVKTNRFKIIEGNIRDYLNITG